MGTGNSGLSSNKGSKIAKAVKDNVNFNAFVKENMSNPDFKAFGKSQGMDAVKQLWYEVRTEAEKQNLHEISTEEAIDAVTSAIPDSVMQGWFVDANSKFKPKLIDSIMSNPGTLNAGMNIAYKNYVDSGGTMSFDKWLKTPQTVYRGDYDQKTIKSDIFMSFTPDKATALKFGSHITTKKVRPIDTWGSYQTTGEQEFLIPVFNK